MHGILQWAFFEAPTHVHARNVKPMGVYMHMHMCTRVCVCVCERERVPVIIYCKYICAYKHIDSIISTHGVHHSHSNTRTQTSTRISEFMHKGIPRRHIGVSSMGKQKEGVMHTWINQCVRTLQCIPWMFCVCVGVCAYAQHQNHRRTLARPALT